MGNTESKCLARPTHKPPRRSEQASRTDQYNPPLPGSSSATARGGFVMGGELFVRSCCLDSCAASSLIHRLQYIIKGSITEPLLDEPYLPSADKKTKAVIRHFIPLLVENDDGSILFLTEPREYSLIDSGVVKTISRYDENICGTEHSPKYLMHLLPNALRVDLLLSGIFEENGTCRPSGSFLQSIFRFIQRDSMYWRDVPNESLLCP